MFLSAIAASSAMKLPGKIAFAAFGLEVYWYGVLLAIGVIAAIILTHFECRRKKLHPDTAVDLCLIVLPCGVIGARIVYVLFNLAAFKGRAAEVLYIWDGGLSLIGAVVFALVGVLIYARKKKTRYLKLLDVMAPGVTAALAISSWGHFFNQDFYGEAVSNAALKWFPLCVRLDDGQIHLALFFYLFVWLALVFCYLWFCLRKKARHDGDVALAFILLYGLAFAVLHALRRDGTADYLPQQIIAAVVFAADLVFLLVRGTRERRDGVVMWPAPEAEEEPDEVGEAEAEAEDDGTVCASVQDESAADADAAEPQPDDAEDAKDEAHAPDEAGEADEAEAAPEPADGDEEKKSE